LSLSSPRWSPEARYWRAMNRRADQLPAPRLRCRRGERSTTLILPDKDVPLGAMKYQHRISVRKVGNTYEATVIPAPAG
jgi:hypothetical protein